MAFEEIKENTDEVQDHAQAYFESSVAYYKLWGFKVAMKSTTMIVKFTLILLCFLMVLLFSSIAFALYLGNRFDNYPLGFLAVGGIYLFFTFILFFIKDKIVEGSLLARFSEIFYNE